MDVDAISSEQVIKMCILHVLFFISQSDHLASLMSELISFRKADDVTHTKLTCLQIDNLNCCLKGSPCCYSYLLSFSVCLFLSASSFPSFWPEKGIILKPVKQSLLLTQS